MSRATRIHATCDAHEKVVSRTRHHSKLLDVSSVPRAQEQVFYGKEQRIRGVATISRLLQIVGLFWKRVLQKRLYSAKKTCNFKEPTDRSHP